MRTAASTPEIEFEYGIATRCDSDAERANNAIFTRGAKGEGKRRTPIYTAGPTICTYMTSSNSENSGPSRKQT